MEKDKIISIIIPVFNEENFIQQTIEKVNSVETIGFKKELIIVNDGSTDSTSQILKNIQKKNKSIIVINKEKNEGKGAVLKKGFLESSGEIVLIQDSDLEYNPDDYPLLLEPFKKNKADVVYGSRFISDRPHRVLYFWHYMANVFLTTFSNLFTNLNLTDMETGYKVFRGDLIRRIATNLKSNRFGFEPEVTARISKIKDIKFYEVGISYRGRTYKEGKKIGFRDGLKTIWEIIRFNLFD